MEGTGSAEVVGVAQVPVAVQVAGGWREIVDEVFQGEYEAGWFGENLRILDLGANVGAFTLWANLRWPGSTIHAYEPHPGTFRVLLRNLASLANATAHNAAVYPTDAAEARLFARFDGDVEAVLAAAAGRTLAEVPAEGTIPVPVVHPAALPPADVVKVDVEGAEAEILGAMDLSAASLVLLEYHSGAARERIGTLLAAEFRLDFEDAHAWDRLLRGGSRYREELAGDHYGRMFFSRRRGNRLRRIG
jgi:FkbM family methyltransferase